MGNYDYTKIKTGNYNYDYTKFGMADYDDNNHCNRLQMITITIVIRPMPDSRAPVDWAHSRLGADDRAQAVRCQGPVSWLIVPTVGQ